MFPVLHYEDPSATYCLFATRTRNKFPCIILLQTIHLYLHCFRKFWVSQNILHFIRHRYSGYLIHKEFISLGQFMMKHIIGNIVLCFSLDRWSIFFCRMTMSRSVRQHICGRIRHNMIIKLRQYMYVPQTNLLNLGGHNQGLRL